MINMQIKKINIIIDCLFIMLAFKRSVFLKKKMIKKKRQMANKNKFDVKFVKFSKNRGA